jgi:hypothetical protein
MIYYVYTKGNGEMLIMTEYIQKRNYNLLGNMPDEIDAIESFINDFSGDSYICDVIAEIADNYIPIYTDDIWKNAYDIKEYIEEAIASGIAGVEGNDIDLSRVFQAGYYQFYSQSLYENLDTMAFNIVVDGVNAGLQHYDVSNLDIDAIEDKIETETHAYDNNDMMSDIHDIISNIHEKIQEGEYNL